VPFLRMNGLGNEFIILDARNRKIGLTAHTVARIADPATAGGCDQLIVMERGEAPADVFMRIFNRDGGEVDACGNATRCIAWLLEREAGGGVGSGNPDDPGTRGPWTIETGAGVLRATVEGEQVRVDMGKPKFDWEQIPLDERMDTRNIDIRLGPLDKPVLIGPSAVNVGNPHCIFFVDDISRHDIEKIGPMIEYHPLFPERTNVEIAQILSDDHIRVRVWERGVGTTRACGTAACAVVPAAVRKGLAARKATVTLDGGDLLIEWDEHIDRIIMTGPVTFETDGELDAAVLSA